MSVEASNDNMSPSVLVIEDYADLRSMIAETLALGHYTCDPVATAEDAIAKLRERRYSAILLSSRLPIAADPVMHFLHEQQPEEECKVIVMAEPEQATEQCPVLFKPFSRDQLFDRLQRALVR